MKHNAQRCSLGGPTKCPDCAAILLETPEQACARMAAEDAENPFFRTCDDAWRAHFASAYAPPDPYAPALARLRAASKQNAEKRTRELAASRGGCAVIADDYAPPDPYALALAKLKENR